MKEKVLILGAAGRDFHNFNTFFRNNPRYKVVGFTATQIPGIAERRYPAKLAGKLYPRGIPIYNEEDLPDLIKKLNINLVCFAYSDVSHLHVMHLASIALANGADYIILGPKNTMLKSKKKVIAVTAVRTGCGKSPTTRAIVDQLKKAGKDVVVIRHPMPYGRLEFQRVQRFEFLEDLDRANCTIEEREEYEPLIKRRAIVYAGVDYAAILRAAEKEADIIIWDGGNNDMPFIKPDLHIVVADAMRPGHELAYHPGEANFRMADIIIINKTNSAQKEHIKEIIRNARLVNPHAKIIKAASRLKAENAKAIKGKRVIAVEDGPTVTHGGMQFGAAAAIAMKYKARLVSPLRSAVGSIKRTFKEYPHLKYVLPAMGYSPKQIKELEKTINNSDAEYVLIGTPVDLRRLIRINKPAIKVSYEIETNGQLADELRKRGFL